MDALEILLTFKELPPYLLRVHGIRYAISTLRLMRSRGEGPPPKFPTGRLYFAPSDVDAWVARRATCGTSYAQPNPWGLVRHLVQLVHELQDAGGRVYTWDQVQAMASERGTSCDR